MPKAKATKKFEKNRLGDVLKSRKAFKKTKQRHQVNDKKKARKARENGQEEEEEAKPVKSKDNASQFEHMSVDQFFQGGFEVPEDPKGARNSKSKEVPSKTGKRKRTGDNDDEEEEWESSDGSVQENLIEDGSDSEADSEDLDGHKDQLAALKTKDPQFYKYLQENDAELLEFGENGDFKEIDALSEDEEKPKKKKQKKDKKSKAKEEKEEEDSDAESEQKADDNEVTKAMAIKWEKACIEKHSLRAMKEVVLAFRAAAHLNDEDGKTYKYSVSSSEGNSGLISSTYWLANISSVPHAAHDCTEASARSAPATSSPQSGTKREIVSCRSLSFY
jgi:nucleolar complex protein 2